MRVLTLLFILALLCPAAVAQKQTGDRDLARERAALAQRGKVEEALPPWAKPRLDAVFEAFLKRSRRDKWSGDPSVVVREELGLQFADLTPQQTHVLTFYVLTRVIELLPPHAKKEEEGSKKDSISELNETDMLMLQRLMEKKNQLETIISNQMKAGFEGGQAALQTLKAS